MSDKRWLAAIALTFIGGAVAGGVLSPLARATVPDTRIAGDAPTKVLIDNDKVKVSLVSFTSGFVRDGGQKRSQDQIIVWLDEGDYTVPPRPGAARPAAGANPPPRGPESAVAPDGSVVRGTHPPGTVVWHPKDSTTPTMQINKPFRSIYIELKK
jgi:hypothetical protein